MRAALEATWDDASFVGARLASRLPGAVRAVSLAAEIAQRPVRAVHASDRLVHVGNDRQLLALLERIFAAQTARIGARAWGRMPRDLPPCDVETVEIAAVDRPRGYRVLPRWVGMRIDLAVDRVEPRRRSILAKIPARGLSPEPSRDFDELYAMYAATARARHGALAFVRRPRYLLRAAREGEILFVREGGRRVSGVLLVPRADGIDAWVTGVRDGDYARADQVVRDATIHFAMERARALSARFLGLTAAAPFRGDGLFRYKKSFGAEPVLLPHEPLAVALRVRRDTDQVRAALERARPIDVAELAAAR